MPSLPEAPRLTATQRDFAAAVLGGPDAAAPLLDQLQGSRQANLRRLAAYHRNVVGNWIAALRSTYPRVAAMIDASDGDGAFASLAHTFALTHDSSSGDLNEYGAGFPDWLENTAIAAASPWLPDLARLEWDVQAAWYAADCAAFDFAALAQIPAELHGGLRFRLAPSFRARASIWPLASLWCDSAPTRIAAARHWLWVVRPGDRVGVETASATEFALIAALGANATLAEAIATALPAEAGGAGGSILVRAAGLGLLAGITLPGESP